MQRLILGPAVGYWRGGAGARGWLGSGTRAGITAARPSPLRVGFAPAWVRRPAMGLRVEW